MNIYGLLIGIGIVIGIFFITKHYKQLTPLNILFLLLCTLIGARLLFVLHNIEEIKIGVVNPYAIWDGGLAFYGGLIGLLFSLWIISKYKNIKLLNLTDSVLLFLPLVHSIGRIGNFFNYELYGKPTSLPWGIFIPKEYRQTDFIQYSYFHPVFLYEALLNILNFILLLILHKKIKREGLITSIYLINYSLIRLFMNTLRIDKEYFLTLETSDILSVVFLISGILLIIMTMKNKKFKNTFAHFISRVVTLSLIFCAVLSVLLNSQLSLKQNIFLFIFSFAIPIITIVSFKLLGITSDFNVSKREERPKLFIVIFLCFLISLIISIQSSQSLLITVYSVLNLSFFLGFLITLFWKISFHMIWSTLSIFFIIYSWQIPELYFLILLLPFIAWSRIQLKRHILSQVIAGFILTALCIALVLTLAKFW